MNKPTPDGDNNPDQTVRLLRHQLDKEPDNQELRLRLVRALHEAGETGEFEREAALYKDIETQRLEKLVMAGAPARPAAGKPVPDGTETAQGRAKVRRFADDPSAAKPLAELAEAYRQVRLDPKYLVQLDLALAREGGRPTPLVHASHLSERIGGAQIYLKYEFIAGSDAHLTIAAAGQAHLAHCLGRKKVVAGVRNLKWGLHMAAACARFGLQSEVFLEKGQYEQQAAQVFQMRLMGAQVTPVDVRNYRGGDVREAGLEAWLQRVKERFLFLGLDSGPPPYPEMAYDHTAVIGRECRRQMTALTRRMPDVVVVRAGENTDALGLLPAFLDDRAVRLISVGPKPENPRKAPDQYDPFHALPSRGEEKRMQALLSGLEYVSVARENAQLRASGRVEEVLTDQRAAMGALREMGRLEGLLVGLQTAHALAWVCDAARAMSASESIVLLVKERGEKDLWDLMRIDDSSR